LQSETGAELSLIDVSDLYAQALIVDIIDQWAAVKGIADLSQTQYERQGLC